MADKSSAPAARNVASPGAGEASGAGGRAPDVPASGGGEQPGPERPKDGGRDLRPEWDGFVAYVRQRKVWMAPVLDMAAGAREQGGELLIRYDDLTDCKILEEPDNKRRLTEFAQDYFQQGLTVRLRIRDRDTAGADGTDMPREDRRSLAGDPLVQAVVEIFNGDVAGVRTGQD